MVDMDFLYEGIKSIQLTVKVAGKYYQFPAMLPLPFLLGRKGRGYEKILSGYYKQFLLFDKVKSGLTLFQRQSNQSICLICHE